MRNNEAKDIKVGVLSSLGLVVLSSVLMLFPIFNHLMINSPDADTHAPIFNDTLLGDNALVDTIRLHIEYAIGKRVVDRDYQTMEVMKRHHHELTYLTAIILSHIHESMAKDVAENNGVCLKTCGQFIVYFNMALGHLCKKDQKDLAKSLGQAAEPMTEVVKHIILTVSGNKLDVIIKAAKELKKNGERLKARDFFYH
ncbi:unnamed protein product [Bursaphelenchus xylophilus]|uniref:(pine wood nematode) hypothetical protein n=1 Tax=Bursaphelenchus xylophilus TaxID=6326 RepID=A0A7I8WZR1_BURXY|nr:unnamed protein product [Bursaphelenchus xylophilus]CAG9102107.1 unnamed protein product [Bursaphelenchus xylophilus]